MFFWGMDLEDKISFPYSPSLSPPGPRLLPIWSLAKVKDIESMDEESSWRPGRVHRSQVPQPNRDPLGKVACSLQSFLKDIKI